MFRSTSSSRFINALAVLAIVLGVVRVGPLSSYRSADAADGLNASLELTLAGPDTFGAATVTTGTVDVGDVFPVSTIIDTDGAAADVVNFTMSYNATRLHAVDATTGADITSIPATAAYLGATNSFAGFTSNTVDNSAGRVDLVLSSTPADNDQQIFAQGDTAAPAGYRVGLDRVVTVYFKAMQSLTNEPISILADTDATYPPAVNRYGDWDSTPAETCAIGGTRPCLYISTDGTVSAGDIRLTARGAYAADSVVAAGDTDLGISLAGGVVAGVGYVDTDADTTRDAAEPVYINLDYPTGASATLIGTVTAGDIRVIPGGTGAAGSTVLGTDADATATNNLRPLANVKQTGSGGGLDDLVGDVAGVTLSTGLVPSAANGQVAGNRTCVMSGTDTLTVTVTVRDSANAVMAGVPVLLTANDASGLTIAPQTPLQNPTTAMTNASGVATYSITAAAGTTGTRIFSASAGSVAITDTHTVTFQTTACASTVSTLTLTASPACVVNNGTTTSTLTVTARDASSNPVSGATVTIGQGSGSSTITPGSGSTNASGVVTFTVANATAETVTYTATSGAVTSSTTNVQFATSCSPVLSGANSRIDASPSACVVTGTGTSTVTVTLRNSSNAAWTTATDVTLQASPSAGVTITPATRTGVTSGTATFSVSSATAQSVTFTALATSTSGAVTVNTPSSTNGNVVVFQAACTTAPTMTIAPSCFTPTGSQSATLTFAGTGTASAPVTALAISGSGMTITPTTGTTTSAGTLAVSINAPVGLSTGSRILSATIASTSVSASFTVASSCSGGTGSLGSSTKEADNADELFEPGDSVDFTITVRNTGSAALSDVRVLDTLNSGFDRFQTSGVTVSSGTSNVTSSQLEVTGMSVGATSGTATVDYTQDILDDNDLLDDFDIDNGAMPEDDVEWWAEDVDDFQLESSDYDDEEDTIDASDNDFTSLGGSQDPADADDIDLSDLDDSSYVILTFGDRAIVNGSDEDFVVLERDPITADEDDDIEEYSVYASQDGVDFTLVDENLSDSAMLDLDDADLEWASYILIIDMTDVDDVDGDAAGADIDAVGIINLGLLLDNTATISSTSPTSTSTTVTETITVDITDAMDETFDPCDFDSSMDGCDGVSVTDASALNSRIDSGDPCYITGRAPESGETIRFTLRDVDNNVMPNTQVFVLADPGTTVQLNGQDAVTGDGNTFTTDSNGELAVRVTSDNVQDVTFTFRVRDDNGSLVTILNFIGRFHEGCELPQTGLGMTLGLMGAAMIPAAILSRRRLKKAAK